MLVILPVIAMAESVFYFVHGRPAANVVLAVLAVQVIVALLAVCRRHLGNGQASLAIPCFF